MGLLSADSAASTRPLFKKRSVRRIYGDRRRPGGQPSRASVSPPANAGRATTGRRDGGGPSDAALQHSLDRVADHLRAEQRPAGYWVGELSTSALATAMSMVGLWQTDRARYHTLIARGRRWLFATQHPDGGWGDAVVDPSNINATSLAIGALTLTAVAGEDEGPDERTALARALALLETFGGWAAVGDPARCTLSGPCRTVAALAGLMDRRRIKRLRPEVILLPPRARAAIRLVSTTFPAYLSISTLHSTFVPDTLNRLPTYGWARARAERWLRRAQGPNGSFEESAFLTSLIVAFLTAAGQGALPWLPEAIHFVIESQRDDGGWPIDRDLETFDTDMAVLAFAEAGRPVPRAKLIRDWLLARQFRDVCFPTGAKPGGWAWAMPAGWPDADDTAYTMLALRDLGVPASSPALQRGADWLEGMQNADGSWPTFIRNSRIPYDHDCPYILGHVLSALHSAGRLQEKPAIRSRALAYLARAQRYDGSFASTWFREATAGTAATLDALAGCGQVHTPLAARACDALLRNQNDDGGWAGVRRQESTAEETAWAVLALLRYPPDEAVTRAVDGGVAWLIAHQRPDGTWTPAPIGLYYSAMWYSDSSYATTLPMRALARAKGCYGRDA